MSKKIRIAILDDHQIVIDGLKLLLATYDSFEIVMEANNGHDLISRIEQIPVDILLSDIMMPQMDGYEVSKLLKLKFPDLKIIMLSMNGEGDLAHKLIHEVKVDGYILKTAHKEELIEAIEKVYEGNTFYTDEVVNEYQAYKKILKENAEIHLTAREIEIINCIAQDLSNKQIADTLFISERTVETHRKNIFRKTDTHSAIALIEFAKKRKLIK